MPLIFSYGTLQEAPVQAATFGRKLEGEADTLRGYERVPLTLADPVLIAATGRVLHANLRRASSPDASVAGTCLFVTDRELALCDSYELLANYSRHEATLESGKTAWVYTFAGSNG